MNDTLSEKRTGGPTLSVCVLASGSKGNATYISDGQTSILVDAGLSGKEIERRMALRGIAADTLTAILISHEHSDHITGAGILSRRYKLPLYANEKTFHAASKTIGRPHEKIHFQCGTPFTIGGLTIHPFPISHDAADPAGFTIDTGIKKMGLATDLGIANLVVENHLQTCHLLVLEANHDPELLLSNENYPWALKQRVKGRKGHLSNGDVRSLLAKLIWNDLSHVVLAHLSQQNNTPEKVHHVIQDLTTKHNINIAIACQDEPGEMIELH